jgi:hypothetical protein
MTDLSPAPPAYGNKERLVGLAIFFLVFLAFWVSPVTQTTDSRYSMLLSQSLLEHRTFTLDQYPLPQLDPVHWPYYISDGPIYQLELINGHVFYHFPPGGPILSLPYVLAARVFGLKVTDPQGVYSDAKETRIEVGLASILMALLTFIFFRLSRLLLPLSWSVIIAVGAAFGSQIWSTASRALWTDTWGTVLLGIALLVLLRHEAGKGKLSPVLFGTLMSWMYFVRPTNSVHIAAITVYWLLFYRPLLLRYVFTGTVWLAAFIAYSWYNFHRPLPTYYGANRLFFGVFWTALAGNIVSPARGLLVYVPVLVFVGYLVIRYRRTIPFAGLVWLALSVIVLHMFVISAFGHWWGGFSFGARFTTGLVPWFVLLAIIGVRAMLEHEKTSNRGSSFGHRLELTTGAALLIMSVAINSRGAISWPTWMWNLRPNIDQHPERLWDWRQPQFLAGLINPPLPNEFPPAGTGRISFAKSDADRYLGYGWSTPEPEARWTDGKEAALIFALDSVQDTELTFSLGAYLVPGQLDRQRVALQLNGWALQSFTITEAATREYHLKLPAGKLKAKNVLTFYLPDAASPLHFGPNPDVRQLAIAVRWMQFGEG